jgi:hypothetical protein
LTTRGQYRYWPTREGARNGTSKALWCHFSYHDIDEFTCHHFTCHGLWIRWWWTQLSCGRLRTIVGGRHDVFSGAFDLQYDLHDRRLPEQMRTQVAGVHENRRYLAEGERRRHSRNARSKANLSCCLFSLSLA